MSGANGALCIFCVYEDSIGMRVSEAVALAAKAAGRASPFTPYGKKPMREWIAVDALDALAGTAVLSGLALDLATAR